MPNVICKKCGAEATSKCPVCRSVFPEDQTDAMYSWLLKFDIAKSPTKGNWLDVHLFVAESEDVDKELIHLRDVLNKLNLEKYSCDHEWKMKEGFHSTIGCGHC